MRKDKLRRLQRATRADREAEEMLAVFKNYWDRLDAVAAGEEPPQPHPRAAELGAGTFLDGREIGIRGHDGPVQGPIEDLSEE